MSRRSTFTRAKRTLPQVRFGVPKDRYAGLGSILKNDVARQLLPAEVELLRIWEKARPSSLRDFDQIPMKGTDLLCQVKLIAPHLAGRRVAFVGDHDGTSLLLGLLSSYGYVVGPAHMTIFDFDERLLVAAEDLALTHGFGAILDGHLYNVFDPVPPNLAGQFDVFYTNPPYGASNQGESARLFIVRGSELVGERQASAYLLLPSDMERPWTRVAMKSTQTLLVTHGWSLAALIPQLHRYHLDDDATLSSTLLCAEREAGTVVSMPWQGRVVGDAEIPHFYGQSVQPPFPLYIDAGGRRVMREQHPKGAPL